MKNKSVTNKDDYYLRLAKKMRDERDALQNKLDDMRGLALSLLDITRRSLKGDPPVMKWEDACIQLTKDLETIAKAKRVLGEKP